MTQRLFLYKKFFLTPLITACFFLLSCENDPRKVEELTRRQTMTEDAKSVECYLSQHGVMRAKLKAPDMIRIMTDTVYVEFPHTLHVDFYNDSTKLESWLDAKYGKYYETLNKVYLKDSVVIINTKGDTLKALDLWWDQTTKLLYTDKPARYFTKDKQITGNNGLVATQALDSIVFKSPTGNVMVSENGVPADQNHK